MSSAYHHRSFPARRDALPQVEAFPAMAQQVEYRRAGDRNRISLVIGAARSAQA